MRKRTTRWRKVTSRAAPDSRTTATSPRCGSGTRKNRRDRQRRLTVRDHLHHRRRRRRHDGHDRRHDRRCRRGRQDSTVQASPRAPCRWEKSPALRSQFRTGSLSRRRPHHPRPQGSRRCRLRPRPLPRRCPLAPDPTRGHRAPPASRRKGRARTRWAYPPQSRRRLLLLLPLLLLRRRRFLLLRLIPRRRGPPAARPPCQSLAARPLAPYSLAVQAAVCVLPCKGRRAERRRD